MSDAVYLSSIYRLEAVNFWESAKTLSAAFETDITAPPGRVTAIPFYLLASHAVELLLKSALLKRGYSEGDLKTFAYRHNLAALLDALVKRGISVSETTTEMVRRMHSQHQNHALRYTALVDDGQPTYMPPPSLVFAALDELLLLTRISTQGV